MLAGIVQNWCAKLVCKIGVQSEYCLDVIVHWLTSWRCTALPECLDDSGN